MMRNNRCGWTIVEMLVVAVIIGLLVSFAIPAYLHAIERSRCSQAIATLRTIRQAEISYFTANQHYSGGDFAALGTITGADLSALDNNHWEYSFTVADPDVFTLQAKRLRGEHAATVITLDELDVWAGSYPIDNP